MEVAPEKVQRLLEIGYMASGYGCFKEAEAIYDGLAAIRPDSEYPWIGRAMARLNMKKPEEAVQILRDQALPKNPDNSLTHSFLGMALQQAGHAGECEAVLNQVIEKGDDPKAVAMARSLMGLDEE